ncbi:thermonuclease family protein [Mesorhizobium sp. VK23B]|uniref:Thermonuclease family protein n=1 Tax=Mesorhizobium dulcispinae TaxID=3072316 RepID=A0ABU4XIB5_9HYPH|nr:MULTISPECIES: thermonuclease family protein [unclassified Mesorhizobium]MDX8468169.1 thermonuclease family protein [Mesorhizobium sp. VK23B]MDX8474507.1 thermonuclease family protein [Mesorhizobium sp. VK23A]
MRVLHLALALLAVPAMAALVVAGGRSLKGSESVVAVDQIDPADTLPGQDTDAAPQEPTTAEPATSAILAPAAPEPPKPAAHSRAIDPEVVAPPELSEDELERVEPRAPLSDLALAGPPKPRKTKMPDGGDGTKLFQPIATAAGMIKAKDYAIAVSGIEIVKESETCSDGGKPWDCGVRARTAFRAFLRGRTVVCAVPPQGGQAAIAAKCWVGNKDVGEWLAENGWARAAQGGPYVEAGEKARAAKKGIFGMAPNLGGLPALPAATGPAPAAPSSILPAEDSAVMPPADQPAPAQ